MNPTQATAPASAQHTQAHTPGPWERTKDGRLPIMVYTDAGTAIANVGANLMHGPIAYLENTANARLIAAAPCLLEALYAALPFVEDALTDPAFKAGYVAGRIREIRQAIARAKGTP